MNKKAGIIVGIMAALAALIYAVRKAGAAPPAGPGEITGQTKEVNCATLPRVTITVYQNTTAIASIVSDDNGNYSLLNIPAGNYNVVANKDGFRDETQAVLVKGALSYTLDFVGDHGLIPDAPDLSYVLACTNLWKFGTPPCQLSESKVQAVIDAWKNPV